MEAKTNALESERIRKAMAERADSEAKKLADQIAGEAEQFPGALDVRPTGGLVEGKDRPRW